MPNERSEIVAAQLMREPPKIDDLIPCHCDCRFEECMWSGQCPPLPIAEPINLVAPAQLSRLARFWRWLGFGFAYAHRPDEAEDAESGWVPGYFMQETFIDVCWRDRLRLLVSGKMMVQVSTQMDVMPGRMRSWSDSRVLPPGHKREFR